VHPNDHDALPEKLRGAGYATHAVGKWHLGHAEPSCLPSNRGFDSFFGYLSGGPDCWTQMDDTLIDLWTNGAPALGKNGTEYLDNLLAKQATQIVQSHPAESPLFLYYGSRSAHVTDTEFQHPEMGEVIDGMPATWTDARKNYTAMIHNLDQHLDTITSALKGRDMWSYTLLLFFSDNGAPLGELNLGLANAPLLGGKATPFEGGLRTPALVSGGRVPVGRRGQVHEGYIHVADWYATFLGMAGVDASDSGEPDDSLDMWPSIVSAGQTSPRQNIPLVIGVDQRNTGVQDAFISGDYKLVRGYNGTLSVPEADVEIVMTCGVDNATACLFNLAEDPSESNNLIAEKPEVAQEIIELIEAALESKDVVAESVEYDCVPVMAQLHGGFFGPFRGKPDNNLV